MFENKLYQGEEYKHAIEIKPPVLNYSGRKDYLH